VNALIIDDEIDSCYLLGGILRNNNIETSYVHTLADAKQALKNHCPEIIFLDNHLPDGRGIDFISFVKKNYSTPKVIIITAYATVADKRKAIAEGADMFIPKPFTRDVINNTVTSITTC
jgi:two-component system, OmpR family, response regulator